MIDILRIPDDVKVICQNENNDSNIRFELKDRKLKVYLKAEKSEPRFICLRWNERATEPVRVMGDKWERSYADLEWSSLNGEKFMPWYFFASNGKETVGAGVMVRPNSFVSFQYDASGVTAWFDVRCGGVGVKLKGRELLAGTVVCETYSGINEFEAARRFCRVMCEDPILPRMPVYGSNNWYYAYGNSSREEILSDTKLIAELTEGIENRPFMVIDDGWSVNRCCGPWRPNEKYGDMKEIADEIKKSGVHPGIWFRPLHDTEAYINHPEWRLHKGKERATAKYLDPSHPGVKEYLRNTVRTIKEWGYELIKHDFSTYDMFDRFGSSLNGTLATDDNWEFYDRSKTGAEIVLDFYRLLREEAGDMYIIGCNTLSHLSAGIFEIYRSGDDTSGRCWSRTRALGVNTLAFRLCQNDTFYKVDADCVGILGDNIDWKLNRQWLELLAKSGTPLFVSAQPSALNEEIKSELKAAFKINAVQQDTAEPIDWLYNNSPQQWLINGEEIDFDFVGNSYPALLAGRVQPY